MKDVLKLEGKFSPDCTASGKRQSHRAFGNHLSAAQVQSLNTFRSRHLLIKPRELEFLVHGHEISLPILENLLIRM